MTNDIDFSLADALPSKRCWLTGNSTRYYLVFVLLGVFATCLFFAYGSKEAALALGGISMVMLTRIVIYQQRNFYLGLKAINLDNAASQLKGMWILCILGILCCVIIVSAIILGRPGINFAKLLISSFMFITLCWSLRFGIELRKNIGRLYTIGTTYIWRVAICAGTFFLGFMLESDWKTAANVVLLLAIFVIDLVWGLNLDALLKAGAEPTIAEPAASASETDVNHEQIPLTGSEPAISISETEVANRQIPLSDSDAVPQKRKNQWIFWSIGGACLVFGLALIVANNRDGRDISAGENSLGYLNENQDVQSWSIDEEMEGITPQEEVIEKSFLPGNYKAQGEVDGRYAIMMWFTVDDYEQVKGRYCYVSTVNKYGDNPESYFYLKGRVDGSSLQLSGYMWGEEKPFEELRLWKEEGCLTGKSYNNKTHNTYDFRLKL